MKSEKLTHTGRTHEPGRGWKMKRGEEHLLYFKLGLGLELGRDARRTERKDGVGWGDKE
jgi:hypothetical protein